MERLVGGRQADYSTTALYSGDCHAAIADWWMHLELVFLVQMRSVLGVIYRRPNARFDPQLWGDELGKSPFTRFKPFKSSS